MKKIILPVLLLAAVVTTACAQQSKSGAKAKESVDWVNPYIGNISHLLVPTFPTIHLPNQMLRVYPERADYTTDQLGGLPLVVTSHRGRSAFNLSPVMAAAESKLTPVTKFTWDNEKITPYSYSVLLDEQQTTVQYAVSAQSAIYEIAFAGGEPAYLVFNTRDGAIALKDGAVTGYQNLPNDTRVYLYAETDKTPAAKGVLVPGKGIDEGVSQKEGKNVAIALGFGNAKGAVKVRYGISFISEEQAKANLRREIKDFDRSKVAAAGRKVWNDALDLIKVNGMDDNDKTLFYTSMYRVYERPVCISEDGRYFSAFDHKVHGDEGTPFYTDDWIWDTYRAAHPLRVLIDPKRESDVITSFLRMAEQMGNMWMPTFPEITGDSRRMNSNHAVATVADAWAKGLQTFDLEKAYEACRKGIEEKTLAPWSAAPAGWLDDFYKKHGYIPALHEGEKETVPEVHSFEKRQPVAVTLGTSYDEWCLSQIAGFLGKTKEQEFYYNQGLNYRTIYNEKTGFFHPRDKNGKFIEPFDYRYSGGQGARDYYGENNGWVYRWDVPHNVADLISMMGGREKFTANLDQTFREPLGKSKFSFYSKLPDHTGNVGQFSMANEPSLHIPYLYNYSGEPWMTQKRIRVLMREWFRNDLMGIPGDEDGGGMSAFVVFSMIGIYPVTPGMPVYNIGSPFFEKASVKLGNGKIFEVEAKNYSPDNKYIQSATLNGKAWDKPWFEHKEIAQGGKLVLTMGAVANKTWGAAPNDAPPSASTLHSAAAK